MTENKSWEEKYAPQQFSDLILTDELSGYFKERITNGLQNMIFAGKPGTGKTTTANILVKEMGLNDYYIRCASDRGVENIDNLNPFIVNMGYDDTRQKVIIFDEADSLSSTALLAIKGIYDLSLKYNCKFIFITNHPQKIIGAIDSRCPIINFDVTTEDRQKLGKALRAKLVKIFKAENVSYDIEHVGYLVRDRLPDYRATINRAQSMTIDGVFSYDEYIKNKKEFHKLIYNIVHLKSYPELIQWLENHSYVASATLIKEFEREFKHLLSTRPKHEMSAIAHAITVLSVFEDRLTRVRNIDITLQAMFFELIALDLSQYCTIEPTKE